MISIVISTKMMYRSCVYYQSHQHPQLCIHLFGSLPLQSESSHLGLVVDSVLGLAFLFKGIDDWLVFPSCFVRQTSNLAVLASWFQFQNTECRGNNHSLLTIIRVWDAVKYLQSVESFHSSLGFVGNHSSHHLEQALAGSTEMVWSLGWLGVHSLPQVVKNLEFVSVEVTRDADAFTSYHHNALSTEDLLCNH